MTDTPQHIKDLQLKIWLSKPPEERLRQFIIENDEWWQALNQAKKKLKQKNQENKSPK